MKIFIVFSVLISAACAATFTNRIIGGNTAPDGQFPYEVSLRYLGRHRCGGCIINDQWILTAAHCVNEVKKPGGITVVAGSNRLKHEGIIYQAEKYFVHENYFIDWETGVNDIALVKLENKIHFSSKVQPIPLNRDYPQHGEKLIISGWGITSYNSSIPKKLKYLILEAVDQQVCRKRFKDMKYKIYDTQLCVFARHGEGACSGDSGSPLVYNGKVAGIASWVEPCAIGYPDVYTRVSEFIDWIEDKINNN